MKMWNKGVGKMMRFALTAGRRHRGVTHTRLRTIAIWSFALVTLAACSTEPIDYSNYDYEAAQSRLDTLNAQLFRVQPYYSTPAFDSNQEDRRVAEQRAQEAEQRQREAERAAEDAERRLRALQ